MKRVLFVLGMLLTFGLFCACSSDDETAIGFERQNPINSTGLDLTEEERALANYCFDGVFVCESIDGRRVVVWLGENPVEVLLPFNQCYVAFQKSDLPSREYKEGNHIFFKIKTHGEAYEDYKNGFFGWGMWIRYNCIVEPC